MPGTQQLSDARPIAASAVPVEYGPVVGYTLAIWPPPDRPFDLLDIEVFDTVEEARAQRNYINEPRGRVHVEIVEVRRVIVE